MKRNLLALFLILTLLVSVAGCGSTNVQEPESTPEIQENVMDEQKAALLVDVAWLEDNLDKVVVIDARGNEEYSKGHIPGAVAATWQDFANMTGKPGETGWGVLLSKEQLAEKIGALGIDGTKQVIVYGQPPGWGEDGRIVWMLRMAGITDAKMLDGGLAAWKNGGGEISKDAVQVAAVPFSIASMDESLTATTQWIVDHQNTIKIVDSRSEKEYNGATDYGEVRGGHLPGAINIPYESMFDKDGILKSSDELKEILTSAGLSPEDEIVTYCTAGIRSAHMALTMRAVGFEKARNYDASFHEWAGDSSLPLE